MDNKRIALQLTLKFFKLETAGIDKKDVKEQGKAIADFYLAMLKKLDKDLSGKSQSLKVEFVNGTKDRKNSNSVQAS